MGFFYFSAAGILLTLTRAFDRVWTMLMIRFQRVGRKNDPVFRLVVTEKRSKPKSGELEILGSRHPKTKETVLKNERILYWISKGARLSPTAQTLLISKGVVRGKKIAVTKPAIIQVFADKKTASSGDGQKKEENGATADAPAVETIRESENPSSHSLRSVQA